MTDTTIQTDDGGHVTMTVDGPDSNYSIHLQKYDASGAAVGSQMFTTSSELPQLVALAGGGYAFAKSVPQRYGAVLDGYVFDASGTRIGGFSGQTQWHLASSPDGGFMVSSVSGGPFSPPIPEGGVVAFYDATGHLVEQAPIVSYGGSPTISVDAQGDYHVAWDDGTLRWAFTLDPRHPLDLTPPAPPAAFQLVDDHGSQTGPVAAGGTTDDTTPVFRVPVAEAGAIAVTTSQGAPGAHFITVTPQDVARGYVDVAVKSSRSDGTFADGTVAVTAQVEDTDGIVSGTTTESFTIQSAPAHAAPTFSNGQGYAGPTDLLVAEAFLANGTHPDNTRLAETGKVFVTTDGGLSSLTVDGHDIISGGAFTATSYSVVGGTLAFTGYDAATGEVDYTFTLRSAVGNPLATGPQANPPWAVDYVSNHTITATDASGAQASTTLHTAIGDDGISYVEDRPTVSHSEGSVSGNVLANDRSADGVVIDLSGFTADGNGGYTQVGTYGTLTLHLNGDYTYQVAAGSGAGYDSFQFGVKSADNPSSQEVTEPFVVQVVAEAGGTSNDQYLTSSRNGDTLTGGAGNDVLVAGQGPDQLTGAGGNDAFGFGKLPWSAGHVTDFTVGADRLDLGGLFQSSGYTGTDPIADGYVSLVSDGADGTEVLYDTDGRAGGNTIQFRITDLDHVSPSGLTWAQLSGSAAPTSPPPPQPAASTPQLLDANHQTGQVDDLGLLKVNESALAWGTAPAPAALTQTGVFYVAASDGLAGLSIDDHQVVDHGAFHASSWDVSGLGTLSITGYDAASGRVDYSFTLAGPYYAPSSGRLSHFTATEHVVATDTTGDQAASNFYVEVDDDGVRAGDDSATAVVGGAAVTGNLLANDRGGDYVRFAGLQPNGGYDVSTARGTLHVDSSGNYTYTPGPNAAAGTDTFEYRLGSSDPADQDVGTLTITVQASSGSGGQVITSPAPGSQVSGTDGSDTIYASQGPDVISTGAGGDVVAFRDLPWNAGHITDFQLGSDHLDLSAIFAASGYSGSDPVADGRMTLQDDGAGGTRVYFDHDQANGGDWPFLITTLDHVSANGLTWAQLSSGSAPTSPPPPPPPPTSGQVITSAGPGSTLTGGAGDDTLNASQGPDMLTGGDGADHFAFQNYPWNAGHITDFTPGVDKLDLRGLFAHAAYDGSDPIADHQLEFRDDGHGNTQVYVDRDAPNSGDWPFLVTTLDHVSPSQIGSGDWLFR